MTTQGGNVAVLGSVSFGWLHEQGGFVFDEPFFLDPHVRLGREALIREFVRRRFPDEPVYNMEAHLVQVEGRRRPIALVGGIQPNLILGAAVGAKFVFYGDKDPDITQTPLAGIRDLDPLWRIDWASTPPIDQLLEQTQATRREVESDCTVVPPFFWDTTGRATTHGIITTGQKLMGERVFLEMEDNPGFVHEFLAWVVDAYVKLIRLFAEAAGMKITGLHTGDCSVCMIGPDQFADFVVPHLNDFVRQIGPVRLHSCGHSDHLLDVFRSVESLSLLNVGSNTSVGRIRERFGPIRIDLIPDTQLLTFGSPDQVDAWVRRSVNENTGGPLQFEYHLDLGQPEDNCLQISRTLEALGMPTQRESLY